MEVKCFCSCRGAPRHFDNGFEAWLNKVKRGPTSPPALAKERQWGLPLRRGCWSADQGTTHYLTSSFFYSHIIIFPFNIHVTFCVNLERSVMAILTAVPGVEIVVQSVDRAGGTDLPEYEDDGGWTYRKFSHLAQSKRSSKYVESKADAEFRIRIVLKYPFQMSSQSVTFKASVDGHGIAQASCTSDYFARASGYYMELICARLDRISPSEISSRPLKFNSLKKGQPCPDFQ